MNTLQQAAGQLFRFNEPDTPIRKTAPTAPKLPSFNIERTFADGYFPRVMSTKTLVAKFQMLPPAAQKQVEALVEDLSAATQAKPRSRRKKRFDFDWAGGLEELKDQFTSVELQHHINELR